MDPDLEGKDSFNIIAVATSIRFSSKDPHWHSFCFRIAEKDIKSIGKKIGHRIAIVTTTN